MDILFNLLLFAHLLALAAAVGTNVAMPLVMRQMGKATPDARASLGAIAQALSLNGRISLGVLVLSGIAMIWVRYGGVAGMNEWFWIKIALVVLIIAMMAVMAFVPRERINPRHFGAATRLVLLGIIFAAVFAFN